MVFTREDKGDRALVKVEGPMTISMAKGLRDELAECFESYVGVILDLAGAHSCDTAGVQLLFSARKTSLATGKDFFVAGASSAVMQSVYLAGLDLEGILKMGEEY